MKKQHIFHFMSFLPLLLAFSSLATASETKNNLKPVAQKIETQKSMAANFETVHLFELAEDVSAELLHDFQVFSKKGLFLELNESNLQTMLSKESEAIRVILPFFDNTEMSLLMTTNEILSDDFLATESGKDGRSETVLYQKGLYYNGIMEMDNNSIAAFSFFDDDVIGIFSNDKGNYVLGRVAEHEGLYVLYNDADLNVSSGFQCGVDDEMQSRFLDKGLNMKIDELLAEPEFSQMACEKTINIYFETDFEMYQDLGNTTTAVNNFVTGMFNVMNTIYANENINTAISQTFVWTTQDSYPTTNSSDALNAFGQTRQDNFNGDLAHLLSTNNNGLGGRAWLDILCDNYYYYEPNDWYVGRFAYTNIWTTYSNFPTYSWTIGGTTHEMGHNLGSPHTHDCSIWANGVAIDWCGPTYDAIYNLENCNSVANPSSGTIMSYCHLLSSIGINFNNGFGTQPGNLIRNNVANASCLPQDCGNPNLTKVVGSENLNVNGTTVSISTSIQNNGGATANSSYVGYYLSTNTTISTSDYLIGTDYVSSLTVGSSSAESITVDVATLSIPAGTYYIGYYIDYQDAVAESDESDNNWAWTSTSNQVTISANQGINLTTQPNIASLNITGTIVDLSISVINDGSTTAGSSYVGYYLSPDEFWNANSDYLIGTDYVPSLASNATSSESIYIDVTTVNPSIPAGNYYVFFIIDYLDAVSENDETDNTWYWSSIEQQVTIPASNTPNLTKVVGSENLNVNGTTVSISTSIQNNGNATANSSYLGYYLSTNTTISTIDYLIGTDYVASLAANSSSAESITVDVATLSIPAGTYYIGYYIDYQNVVAESDETDNDWAWTSTSNQVTIPDASQANLFRQTGTGSLTVSGTNLSIASTIANNGNASANTFRIGYYLSTNTSITTSDYFIGYNTISSLAANSSQTINFNKDVTTVTPEIPAGTYYIGGIVDYQSAIAESDESDNTFNWTNVSKQITIPNASQANLFRQTGTGSLTVSGTNLSIASTIANNGNASANTFRIGYYLSTNTTISTSDYFIGYNTINSLAANSSQTINFNKDVTTVTPEIPAGTYYIGGIVDYQSAIAESDESDNTFNWTNVSKQITISNNSDNCVPPNGQNENIGINGPSTIRLSWNSVAGATAYQIKGRKLNANGNPGPWKYWTVTNTYRDFQGLVSGNTYQWTVQSICSSGSSDYASPIRQIVYSGGNKLNNLLPDPFDAEKVASLSNLQVYPNPATSQVNLNFVANFEESKVVISIYDIVGKKVLEQTQNAFLGNNNVVLDIDKLMEGCYFIEINDGKERIIEKLTIL